jgi:hypothetical protein
MGIPSLRLVPNSPRAPLLQPGQQEQNCSTCRHALAKCHMKGVSDRNVAINILVCRIQLNIQRETSTKNLLELLRPGMINIISSMRRSMMVDIDFDQMLMDMQSNAIELIMHKYSIGEPNPITPFLFSKESGHLVKWARWYVSKIQRWNYRHELYDELPIDNDTDHASYGMTSDMQFSSEQTGGVVRALRQTEAWVEPEHDGANRLVDTVSKIIEDGVTLNFNEYRVMKFCTQNCTESNDTRLIDGLHLHLAAIMGVSRPRITRLYKRSKDKLIAAYAIISKDQR